MSRVFAASLQPHNLNMERRPQNDVCMDMSDNRFDIVRAREYIAGMEATEDKYMPAFVTSHGLGNLPFGFGVRCIRESINQEIYSFLKKNKAAIGTSIYNHGTKLMKKAKDMLRDQDYGKICVEIDRYSQLMASALLCATSVSNPKSQQPFRDEPGGSSLPDDDILQSTLAVTFTESINMFGEGRMSFLGPKFQATIDANHQLSHMLQAKVSSGKEVQRTYATMMCYVLTKPLRTFTPEQMWNSLNFVNPAKVASDYVELLLQKMKEQLLGDFGTEIEEVLEFIRDIYDRMFDVCANMVNNHTSALAANESLRNRIQELLKHEYSRFYRIRISRVKDSLNQMIKSQFEVLQLSKFEQHIQLQGSCGLAKLKCLLQPESASPPKIFQRIKNGILNAASPELAGILDSANKNETVAATLGFFDHLCACDPADVGVQTMVKLCPISGFAEVKAKESALNDFAHVDARMSIGEVIIRLSEVVQQQVLVPAMQFLDKDLQRSLDKVVYRMQSNGFAELKSILESDVEERAKKFTELDVKIKDWLALLQDCGGIEMFTDAKRLSDDLNKTSEKLRERADFYTNDASRQSKDDDTLLDDDDDETDIDEYPVDKQVSVLMYRLAKEKLKNKELTIQLSDLVDVESSDDKDDKIVDVVIQSSTTTPLPNKA